MTYETLFCSQGPKGQKGAKGELIFTNIYLVCLLQAILHQLHPAQVSSFLRKYVTLWK